MKNSKEYETQCLTGSQAEQKLRSWGTHDITDYQDVLEPVDLKFSDGLAHDVLIRFASHTFWKVCRIASERGKLR